MLSQTVENPNRFAVFNNWDGCREVPAVVSHPIEEALIVLQGFLGALVFDLAELVLILVRGHKGSMCCARIAERLAGGKD